MRRHLLTVLNYFGYFSYAPSYNEVHTFFPKRISKKELQELLKREAQDKKILRLSNNRSFILSQQSIFDFNLKLEFPRYTLPQYSIDRDKKLNNKNQNKNIWTIMTIQIYIKILKALPFIQFIGITGASAMRGLEKNDDLDLCVVTKYNVLWTTRFFAVVCAKMLRIHHQRGVCLNLFFDESDLGIAQHKQNSYIAHELLQMKPIIDKNHIYRQFLTKNRWIYQYFPNAQSRIANRVAHNVNIIQIKRTNVARYTLHKHIDQFFKSFQLPIIRNNHAAFFITRTQLWLFKNDFEKKLKRVGLVI